MVIYKISLYIGIISLSFHSLFSNADAFPNDPSASAPIELNDTGKLLVQSYGWIDNGDGTLTTPNGQIMVGYAKDPDPDPEPDPEPEPEPDGSLFIENLSFEILGNVAQITGYNDSAPVELIIPSSYNGIPVTAISDDAFNGLGNIYSVYIPQSITSIGHNAFRDCINLVNVEISSINPSMGNFVFRGCSNLVNIMLPSSLSEVPGGIFTNCHSLVEVVVPESVTTIGEYAFFDCISMTGIYFLGDAPSYSQLSFGGTNNAKAKVLSSASGFPSSFYGNNPNLVVQYISLQDFPEYAPSELTLPIAIDTDGDGVGDNADAFPNDASETTDTDGDEVGDNADDDDDNDSLLDVKELLLGSDPLVADNFSSIVSHINSLADEGDSFPGNDELFSLQEIQDLRAGSTLIEIQNGQAILSIDVEQSDNLETWTSGSSTTLQIPLDAESDTKFFRFKMTE